MKRSRDIRRVLQDLMNHGVLIGYNLSVHFGQTVIVWGEDGRPVKMCLSSAGMYADRLEDMEWGLLT